MSREFPDWVNPWKAAEGNRIYRGTIALGKMDRLVPLLAEQSGQATFEAGFTQDGLGFATIRLQVSAKLSLLCQASLERYLQSVERQSLLAVIENIEQQDRVPGHYETVWIDSGRLEFLSLVQDELILEVPQVPRKPGVGDIRYSTGPDDGFKDLRKERNKPFAALETLLQNEQEFSEEDQD